MKTNISVTNYYTEKKTQFDDGHIKDAQDFIDQEIAKSNGVLNKDSIVLRYDEFVEPHYPNAPEGSIWDY